MSKRVSHIFVIAVLVLNLSGVTAFAFSSDCGMECCRPSDWKGTVSYEAASCCDLEDVTCGFETGQFELLFDEAICCHKTGNSTANGSDVLSLTASSDTLARLRTHAPAYSLTGSPPTAPIFLSNAAILC